MLRSAVSGWERAAPLSVSRHGLALIALGSDLYAIGGCTEELKDSRANEVFRRSSELPDPGA